MGENPKFVFNTGSLAIDEIKENISAKTEIAKKMKRKITGEEIILIQHPVTTQLNLVEKQINNIAGVVTNGIFAIRPADVVLIGQSNGVLTLENR